jgi:hypothetical protein
MQHARDIKLASAATEWGLPDWRDAAAYGAIEDWNENRWRWEFTRRREDYRADFDRWAADSYSQMVELYKTFKPGGQYISAEQILKPMDPGFSAIMPGPLKYGLPGLPNPRISEQPFDAILFRSNYGSGIKGEGLEFLAGGRGISVDAPEGKYLIEFNLKLPIKPQLEGLQSRLEVQQKLACGERIKSRRQHPRTWPRYLRVIDGREAGASLSELAEIAVVETEDTVPTPQGAKMVWDAARALMFNWPA